MTKFTNPCPLEQELNEQYYKALEKEINKEILKEVSQKMKMGEGYCPRCLKSKENCTCLEDSFKRFPLKMNREEEIRHQAKLFGEDINNIPEGFKEDFMVQVAIKNAFAAGAEWADKHIQRSTIDKIVQLDIDAYEQEVDYEKELDYIQERL